MRLYLISFLMVAQLSFAARLTETAIDETASYVLNNSPGRTSWLINEGKAHAVVEEYKTHEEYGPGYLVRLHYDLDVMFKGPVSGKIGLFVPERVFTEEFIEELKINHPQNLGQFEMDYLGSGAARDANGNQHADCAFMRAHNFSNIANFANHDGSPILMLWHEKSPGAAGIRNLSINLKVNQAIPVFGAVQLDVSGITSGVDFKAGFDFKPEPTL